MATPRVSAVANRPIRAVLMVAALSNFMAVALSGENVITLHITCLWIEEKEFFEPGRESLDAAGNPFGAQRSSTRERTRLHRSCFFSDGPRRAGGNSCPVHVAEALIYRRIGPGLEGVGERRATFYGM